MAQEEVEETDNQPKKVKLRRKKQSFGFKVRGQVAEGGPRWLINGREYRNLQTVSDVVPDSVAEESGISVGDKILSINGVEVEGAEHETIKDLISGSGDEVELLLITPKDAKMLDIPSSVLIHRSDGSTLSLDKASLLQHPTIDEALHVGESNEKMVQINKTLPKDDNSTIPEEQEDDIELDNTKEDEDHPTTSDNANNEDNEEEQHVEEENEETIGKNSDDAQGEEHGHEEEDQVKDEQYITENNAPVTESNSTEGANEEQVNEEENDEEQSEDRSSTDSDHKELNIVDENEVLISGSNTEKEDRPESNLSVKSTEEISECSCGVVKQKKSPRVRSREEREIERLKSEMKTMMSSVKRLKLSPFSPDIYNNLSPYFSINIKTDDSQSDSHSSRYGQRATALRVLHPAEALRLENSNVERQIGTWSANLFKRSKPESHEIKEETTRLRDDVRNMYKSIMEKRGRTKHSPLLTDKKLTSLSEQFIKSNAQKTLATYLGLGKVS